MTQERKEKLKAWIQGTGECEEAKTEEAELPIGFLLWQERIRRDFAVEDVADGICGKTTLERMENVEKMECMLKQTKLAESSDCFLVCSLLNRMGMSAGKFEFYCSKGEEENRAARNRLVAWRVLLAAEKRQAGESGKELEACNNLKLKYSFTSRAEADYKQALAVYEEKHHAAWDRMWVYWQCYIYELSCNRLPQEDFQS